jgi:hypothetical protein
MLEKLGPIGVRDSAAGEREENGQQDQTAANAGTREAAAETEALLQPVEQLVEQKELE